MSMQPRKVLLLEPFYGGSHKQLIDFLVDLLRKQEIDYELITLPAKKWHWRARTGALNMYKAIPRNQVFQVIFCSSVLNLAELIALRPDLSAAFKITYFHENQFIYPKQQEKERDFQYGYNTILSALVTDKIIFNSHFNMSSFLNNISKHLRTQPDFRVSGLEDEIRPKCSVIYFPVKVSPSVMQIRCYDILHIVWPHRWEHDKGPEIFFGVLFKIKETGAKFVLSVLGESYSDPIPIFTKAQEILRENILRFGKLDSKEEYFSVLSTAHVVVSTARHEFFGVAMVEGVKCGCYPLAPNSLVYPEIYPPECLYNTPQQLYKQLIKFCKRPSSVQDSLRKIQIPTTKLCEAAITTQFMELFTETF